MNCGRSRSGRWLRRWEWRRKLRFCARLNKRVTTVHHVHQNLIRTLRLPFQDSFAGCCLKIICVPRFLIILTRYLVPTHLQIRSVDLWERVFIHGFVSALFWHRETSEPLMCRCFHSGHRVWLKKWITGGYVESYGFNVDGRGVFHESARNMYVLDKGKQAQKYT